MAYRRFCLAVRILIIIPLNWFHFHSLSIDALQSFEKEILSAMKKDGWDGIEDVDQIQWTFFGALFYSIIVITTIGKSSQGDC